MKRSPTRGLELVSVGIAVVIATVLGYAGGSWLDGKWGTAPWLGVVGLMLGAVAGFAQLYRAVAALDRASGDDDGQ